MVLRPHDAFYKCDHCGHMQDTYSDYGVSLTCKKCGKPVINEIKVKGKVFHPNKKY